MLPSSGPAAPRVLVGGAILTVTEWPDSIGDSEIPCGFLSGKLPVGYRYGDQVTHFMTSKLLSKAGGIWYRVL
jgi:hypothetical protein